MSITEKVSKKAKGSKLRVKWRKLSAYFFIVCLLGYAISLLILNSSWFKDKITSKLNQKLPSNWEVGFITWLPFGNITINNLETSLGVGGLHLDSIKITPSWDNLFSGDFELNGLAIDKGKLDIDLEWLKEQGDELTKSTNQNLLPSKTETPRKRASPKKTVKENNPKKRKPKIAKTTPQKTNSVKEVPKQKQEPENFFESPNKWLKVNHFTINIQHQGETIEEIKNISLKIPFSGKPIEGEILGEIYNNKIKQVVKWNGSTLYAEDLDGLIFGIQYQWQIGFNIRQVGLPFKLSFRLPKQELDTNINRPNFHWSFKAKEIDVNFNMNGGLKLPKSWRGIFLANAKNLIVSEIQKTKQQGHFDYARIVANYSQGALYIPSAEAIGYDTSILANGVVRNNLYSYGIIRMITHNKAKEFFDRVHRGTQAIHLDHSPWHFFQKLDTRDRFFCDLYFDGQLSDLEKRHNRSNRWQKVKHVIKLMINFKDRELDEDGILEVTE